MLVNFVDQALHESETLCVSCNQTHAPCGRCSTFFVECDQSLRRIQMPFAAHQNFYEAAHFNKGRIDPGD